MHPHTRCSSSDARTGSWSAGCLLSWVMTTLRGAPIKWSPQVPVDKPLASQGLSFPTYRVEKDINKIPKTI